MWKRPNSLSLAMETYIFAVLMRKPNNCRALSIFLIMTGIDTQALLEKHFAIRAKLGKHVWLVCCQICALIKVISFSERLFILLCFWFIFFLLFKITSQIIQIEFIMLQMIYVEDLIYINRIQLNLFDLLGIHHDRPKIAASDIFVLVLLHSDSCVRGLALYSWAGQLSILDLVAQLILGALEWGQICIE